MSFTTRILTGNAVIIIITLAAISALNPASQLWLNALVGLALIAGSSAVL